MSFSDIAGTDTFMPGSDSPLLLLTGPPSVTVQTTSSPSTMLDHQADLAVVDQQPVTGLRVLGQLACRWSTPGRGCPHSRRP